MESFTPGPWEIIQLPSMEYRIDAKVGPLHICPAIAHGLSDAHLIKSAPDMMEVLRRVDYTLSVHGHIDADTSLHEFVCAVIARAKGEA